MRKSAWLGFRLGLALALIPSSMAWAHAVLVSAVTTPNGLYPSDDPPRRVVLTFSKEVSPAFSSIRVFNQSSQVVDNGDLQAADVGNTALTVTLKPLASGIYTVAWEVLSNVDGHRTSDSFAFGMGVVVEGATGTESVGPAPGSTPASLGARWLTITGQVLLIGVFLFRFLVWRPTSHAVADDAFDLAMARQTLRVGWIGLGLVAAGMVLTIIAQSDVIGELSLAKITAGLARNSVG